MFDPNPNLRIAIYGTKESTVREPRGCGLWPVGYYGTVSAAGATPQLLPPFQPDDNWKEILAGIDGVVFESAATNAREQAAEEALCKYCKKYRVPLLAVDRGLHVMNRAFSGTNHESLAKELPEALQHRHPPEPGTRHAIMVAPDTRLAHLYGEGEVVVNSEHRTGVNQPAKGFRVSATALDGVIEAIETETNDWYAMGVQWRPASGSASGLDIQVFRGVINAAEARQKEDAEALAVPAA